MLATISYELSNIDPEDYTDFLFSDFPITDMLHIIFYFQACFCLLKYIYLEYLPVHKRARIIYTCIVISSCILAYFRGFEESTFIIDAFLFISIFMRRKKHKSFAIVECLSVIGLFYGLSAPFLYMPSRIIGEDNEGSRIIRLITCIVILIICLMVGYFSRNWRQKYTKELSRRSLRPWQLILLSYVGVIMFALMIIIQLPNDFLSTIQISPLIYNIFITWTGLLSFSLCVVVITAVIIANRQNFYHQKINDMQYNIIVMMAEIVENRDQNTGGHIQRTANYVEIIARQLQREGKFKNILTERYITDMKVAAPLHDIGKIHVSDLILNKPARLDDAEYEIMKTHASEGKKLLSHAKDHLGEFDYLDMAVDMAAYHHEWWDGSSKGYPEHKKGEEIPLCARIMAVADVFDALTSKRCYKEPMSLEAAYQIICSESGTHFDKEIVDAFCAAKPQIKTSLNTFMEGEYKLFE